MPGHQQEFKPVGSGRVLKRDKRNRKRRKAYVHHGKPGRPRIYQGRKSGHHLLHPKTHVIGSGTGRFY